MMKNNTKKNMSELQTGLEPETQRPKFTNSKTH